MRRGNAEALKAAAHRKSAAAKARADAGIRALIKSQRPINFQSVAQEAHVSKDFLYRTPELRGRIVRLRARTAVRLTNQTTEAPSEDSTSSVVRTLTVKLAEERTKNRAEIAELRHALEAAHAELLRLRRQLGHSNSVDRVGG